MTKSTEITENNNSSQNLRTKIGEGAYATVYLSEDKKTAIKAVDVDNKLGIPFTTLREIKFMKKLSHPNICSLKDVYVENNKVNLIMDYYKYDLEKILSKKKEKSNTMVVYLIDQILRGLCHMHENNILHRDLKPANILIGENGDIKLGDFGVSREENKRMTNNCITLMYRAPELLLGETEYDEMVDIWSVGCIFYELLNKTPCFKEETEITQLKTIIRMLGEPEKDYKLLSIVDIGEINYDSEVFFEQQFKKFPGLFADQKMRTFYKKTLNVNPEKRYSARNLLNLLSDFLNKEKKEVKNILKIFLE